MKPRDRLAGRVALISGGANGAGASSVRLFAQESAKVAIVDKDVPAGRKLEMELLAKGHEVAFIAADVSKPDQASRAVERTLERFGQIDILFNHAGIIIVKPFLEFSIEEWDELMENNAKSVFLMTRLVLPEMLKRGYGVIVNTSSSAVRSATHLESLYCASKAAMNQLARALAVEYRDRGIRCNNICPSFVRTQHGEHEIKQLRAYGVFASERDVNVMQGRICEPEEVANVALFLASDESSFINGAEIFVDNTFTAV